MMTTEQTQTETDTEAAILRAYRERIDRLEEENLQLRGRCDSLRTNYTTAKVDAASGRLRAFEEAAQIALHFCVQYGDCKEYPSAVCGEVHDAILRRAEGRDR